MFKKITSAFLFLFSVGVIFPFFSFSASVGDHIQTTDGQWWILISYISVSSGCKVYDPQPEWWETIQADRVVRRERVASTNPSQCFYVYDVYEYWEAESAPPPDPCELAGKNPVADCGSLEQTMFTDAETCEYHCTACDDAYNTAIDYCGGIDNAIFDPINCDFACSDCDGTDFGPDQDQCALGWRWTDYDMCQWSCNDTCDQAYLFAQHDCYNHNGLHDFNCIDSSSGNEQSMNYNCNDSNTDPLEPPSDPPDPDPTPDTDPDPDPTPDPNDTPGQETNKWLSAIKHNTDTMIDQNDDQLGAVNESNSYLENIDSNIQSMVTNQGKINDSLGDISNKQGTTNSLISSGNNKLADINDSIGQTNDKLDGIGDKIDEMKFEGTVPDVPQFDSTLSAEYDYTQYSDPDAEATDDAIVDYNDIIDDPSESPFDGSITASNVNACISGAITVHNSNVPVSVCFDHPWMLTGYRIMKIFMIFLGYLQTAMLLNKAILS